VTERPTNASGDTPAAPNINAPTSGQASANTRALLSRLPRYQQIAEDLRRQIESGDLAPGAPLPSETALIDRYSVSRITARSAVRALRAAGLVVTEHGRATYVRPAAPAGGFEFDPTIHVDGNEYTTWDGQGWTELEEPSRYRTESHGEAGRLLDLTEGEPLFVYERLLVHGSGTRAAHRLCLPFPTALDTPLEADPFRPPAAIYAALADAGHELHWRDHTVARMPTPDDAAALDIGEGVPLLIYRRLTLDADGQVLALEETRLPADRTRIGYDTEAAHPRT
jgi:GntR family transcriptional regulator